MQKQIKTYFACNDIEFDVMCLKAKDFDGFAINASHLFFPLIQKSNAEQDEPTNLIPLGFLKNHTYYNTIYYPRALEWKFIFDSGKNVAKPFETDLAVLVWYLGKSFDHKKTESSDNEKCDRFNDTKDLLNKNFIYLPDSQLNWLAEQDLFVETAERIFSNTYEDEGFETTKSLALQYAIDHKSQNNMVKDLKYAYNMVDEEEILEYVFVKNDPIEEIEKLKAKSSHYIKILFSLLNPENVEEFISKHITEQMYNFLVTFKNPEELAEIIKICPQFYDYVGDDEPSQNVKKALATDKSKADLSMYLIKYARRKGDDLRKIKSYLDMINDNQYVPQFLLELSKITDAEAVDLLINQYKNYFSTHKLSCEVDHNQAMAIYLNLYFNFGQDVAQGMFNVDDETLVELQKKLSGESGEINMDYVSEFLINAKPELQTSFIKDLNKRTQQKLKESFSNCKNFATRMKLAAVVAKMKNV